MTGIDDIETAAIKACEGCTLGILDRDNFCRWCGAAQSGMTAGIRLSTDSRALVFREPSHYQTTELGHVASTNSLHRVSGPLMSAVVATLATGAASQPRPSLFARAIVALLSVPLWLMIVLLSPLDAYAAAKNLSRGL